MRHRLVRIIIVVIIIIIIIIINIHTHACVSDLRFSELVELQ